MVPEEVAGDRYLGISPAEAKVVTVLLMPHYGGAFGRMAPQPAIGTMRIEIREEDPEALLPNLSTLALIVY